jgi:hypothetical protein
MEVNHVQKAAFRKLRKRLAYQIEMDMFSEPQLPERAMTALHEHCQMVRAVQGLDVATGDAPDATEYERLRHCASWALGVVPEETADRYMRQELVLDTARILGVVRVEARDPGETTTTESN